MTSANATATISLGLELASLQTGFQQAATIAEQKGQSIKAALLRATDSGVAGFRDMGSSIASALNPINLVSGALGSLTANLGLGIGAAGLGGLIASSIAAADSMADLSIKTGIQVEQLSRFTSIAKLSGTSMDEVAIVIKKLSISAVDAYSGNDKLARSFDALGISVKDLKNVSPDELLIRVAQGIQGIDPMIVQDLMAQLGGRGAMNVLPFLRELTERIDQTGVKISTQFAKDAKEFTDNLVLLKGSVTSLSHQLTATLLPSLTTVLAEMVKAPGIVEKLNAALRGSVAAVAIDYSGNLPAQLARAELILQEAKIARNESDDPGVWEEEIKRKEAYVRALQDRIAATQGKLNPDIDPTKNQKALGAAAANNSASSSASDGFLKGLQTRIEKAEQGEYAMLRLQAAEKGVAEAASPLIAQLKLLDEARAVSNYKDELERQNAEIQFQNSLIGKSASEVALLNIQHKVQMDLARQIEQIERSKGAISAENIAQLQAAAEASVVIQQASISSRLQLEKRWETGAISALQKYEDTAGNIAKSTETAFTTAFKGIEDSLVSLAMTGQLNFTNLANSIVASIIRIQAQAAAAGLANMLGKLIGSAFAASDLPDASGQHSVQGNADYVYDLHTGGIAGQGGSSSNLRDMSMFANAPRYHNGGVAGLKPNEVPAVLLRGERVLPPGATTDASNINIVINNTASDTVETTATTVTNENGQVQIEMEVRKIMMNDVSRNGPFTRSIAAAHGLKRVG